ncbi:MAG: hypothetical protein ACYS5W_03820 [Planctomycetota bacterium]
MQTPRSTLLLPLALGLAVITSPVQAQNVYSPAPLAHHAGMTSTGYPFGYTGTKKMTYQQVHGDLPKVHVFKSLAWRPWTSTASHGTFNATMTLTFGSKGPTPDNATTSYATNLGASPTVVLKNTTVKIGAYVKPPQPPGAFVYRVPLAASYVYTGNGTFCWECRLHNHTSTQSLSFDLYYHRTTIQLQRGGQGCTASGMTSPANLTGAVSGTSLTLTASNMPSAGGALLAVGFNSTPLDLTPLGAPCALRTDILALLPGKSTGSTATWQGTIPTTAPDGTAVFLQAGAADSKANAMGLVLSNGLCALWPYTKRPVVRIWSNGSDTATTGSRQLPYGLVIKLGP